MRSIAVYLPALACGVMMLAMCVPMLLGRNKNGSNDGSASQQEIAELREEVARLKVERVLDDKSEARDG